MTLYQRLGAYDVIAAIVDDLFAALRNDPRFSRFGTGRSLDSRERARRLFVDQMCALTGWPCIYIGRDMTTSYAGLGITDAEWEANKGHTAAVLDRHGIGRAEKAEFLHIFEGFRGEIVECQQHAHLSASASGLGNSASRTRHSLFPMVRDRVR